MILHCVEAGDGEPVALLHGLFGSARNLRAVQRPLAAQFRTLAIDLRNHGNSPHDPDMRYETMAKDVLETLRAHAALPATLIGHSMGGKVAMMAALSAPDLVTKLVIADIAPVRYPPHYRDIAAAMEALALKPGLTRADADAALADAVPERGMRDFLLQNLQPGAAPAWRIGLAEIIAGFSEIEAWDAAQTMRYAGPTLFIAGARSDYIQPEHRAIIRNWFPSARFVTLKNAGHWLHADNPEGFVASLQVFLTAPR